MKLLEFFKTHKPGIVSMLLIVIATALGADSGFAMAEVAVTTETATATADDQGMETQIDAGATATHATETGFEEDEYEDKIALFRPFRFPLEYDIIKNAVQVPVKSYHPKHFRSGSAVLETTLKAKVTATGTGKDEQKIALTASNCNNIEMLTECSCVYAKGVAGYDQTGTKENGDLAMYVIKNDDTTATLLLLNPKDGTATELPSGTELIIGATAGSESQMIVDPENYQPKEHEVYLQKKIANIVFTDEWLEQAKKVKFIETDLRNNALYNFKRKNARSHWLGVKKVIKVKVKTNNKMGDEFVYFEEGVLRQINKYYSYNNDTIEATDLTGIAKMQFAKNSVNDVARVYCGKNAIERLLNIDLTVHKEIKFEEVDEAGMTIRAWKNNFGKLEFVHDPTLDDIGYEDFMVVVDIRNACRYVKRAEKTDKQDMKKGTGEVREAQREIYSTIDCIALKGYNAILVGPADQMGRAAKLNSSSTFASSSATVPTDNLTDGMIVYLTASDGGFKAGTLIEYDLSTDSWHEYDGEVIAA